MAERVVSEGILKCVPSSMEQQFEMLRNQTLRNKFLYSCKLSQQCALFPNFNWSKLYMFRTDLRFIIRSLNTAFTATRIFHTSYVECLLVSSESSLADSQHK
jgi:hypothetical protein